MNIYLFCIFILIVLAISDLIVGVSNDAANFLNSSIGSRVAPRNVIIMVASLGMLAGVTFSSGMMEVARKGIFQPELFAMPDLMTIFLAVMLTDVLLLDIFNTFGLPTSTTVSIIFELLGAAVAVSIMKIYAAGDDLSTLLNYINTAKVLAIIMGILFSVAVAFFSGALAQFISRLVFTFDYKHRLNKYGGIWAGIALAVITYFILIKGAKGTSFLAPETVLWINTHAWIILVLGFIFFAILFQTLILISKINILKPIILVGTFALAMSFAANDLVNFIGVPLAGLSAYQAAYQTADPLNVTMDALREPVQINTLILLLAGIIMVVTLWRSKKARTVSQTEVSLARQDEGIERFGASTLSRIIVRIVYGFYRFLKSILPAALKRKIARRMDKSAADRSQEKYGKAPSFDLLRASVNLIISSALISLGTSLKLPLSTTYVTFMVAMGTSLSDQAWGRENAVYRVTGVLTVIGGWFFTAFIAFTGSLIFAFIIYCFKFPAIIGLVFVAVLLMISMYRYHGKKEEDTQAIEALGIKSTTDSETAVKATFEQTGLFLKEISDTLGLCIEAAFSEDRQRLKDARTRVENTEKWSNVIVANIFKTLFLLHKEDVSDSQKYSHAIRSVQAISESHRDIILRVQEHFDNYHPGFNPLQKEELRQVKANTSRLLWNTSIMLLNRKKVDYDYIANQSRKLKNLIDEFDKNQIRRIQDGISKTRLSVLFYGIMENSSEIAEHTVELLDIFKRSFDLNENNVLS